MILLLAYLKNEEWKLSLLLYCIPFVYSGQRSAFQRDTLPTHTAIINIESDVRPLQHQLHFIIHTHTHIVYNVYLSRNFTYVPLSRSKRVHYYKYFKFQDRT